MLKWRFSGLFQIHSYCSVSKPVNLFVSLQRDVSLRMGRGARFEHHPHDRVWYNVFCWGNLRHCCRRDSVQIQQAGNSVADIHSSSVLSTILYVGLLFLYIIISHTFKEFYGRYGSLIKQYI